MELSRNRREQKMKKNKKWDLKEKIENKGKKKKNGKKRNSFSLAALYRFCQCAVG
jgi:hypothetical protein